MTYVITDQLAGSQAVADTSTTQKHPLGTVVRGVDPTYGAAEFIYLKGVASTVVGSVVTYNTTSFATALAAVGTNLPQPIAIAMSANVASQYGWYQVSGIAVAKKAAGTSLAANAVVGVKTIGLVAATGTGKEVQGALVAAVASAKSDVTTVSLVVNRPHMQGRIT